MRCLLSAVVAALVSGAVLSQPEEKLTSGPQRGKPLPGTFAPLNINGEGKDRYRCLVTLFGQEPTVIVFAREPAAEKAAALTELLKKLDAAIKAKKDEHFLGGFVVFLNKAVRGTAADAESDAGKLVEEAQAHQALVTRLRERAKDFSDLIVAAYPQSPKDYKIDDKAAVTVLLCRRQVVRENWAFGEDQMTAEDVSKVVKAVESLLK